MGRWVMGEWVEWVIFWMGHMGHGSVSVTHDHVGIFAYTVKLASRYQKSKNASLIENETH